jgi:hypothetical protein
LTHFSGIGDPRFPIRLITEAPPIERVYPHVGAAREHGALDVPVMLMVTSSPADLDEKGLLPSRRCFGLVAQPVVDAAGEYFRCDRRRPDLRSLAASAPSHQRSGHHGCQCGVCEQGSRIRAGRNVNRLISNYDAFFITWGFISRNRRGSHFARHSFKLR